MSELKVGDTCTLLGIEYKITNSNDSKTIPYNRLTADGEYFDWVSEKIAQLIFDAAKLPIQEPLLDSNGTPLHMGDLTDHSSIVEISQCQDNQPRARCLGYPEPVEGYTLTLKTVDTVEAVTADLAKLLSPDVPLSRLKEAEAFVARAMTLGGDAR